MILNAFMLFGTFVFAMSGALAAGRKQFDFLGVFVIAVVTAIGGGTVRDVLLNRHPIFWIKEPTSLAVIGVAAFFTILYVRYRRPPWKALLYADAVGLAVFTISGVQIAEEKSLPALAVIVMGAITGSAGGVIRDVLSAEVPMLLRGDLYATASIVGGTVYLLVQGLPIDRTAASLIGMFTVGAIRFAAIRFRIGLPVFKVP